VKWSAAYPYTRLHVRTLSPCVQGVYRLSICNRTFYVGKSRNLRRRLREHLSIREGNRCLLRYLRAYRCFFRFAELTPGVDLLAAERDLIRRHKPPCNIDVRTLEEATRPPKRLTVMAFWRKACNESLHLTPRGPTRAGIFFARAALADRTAAPAFSALRNGSARPGCLQAIA